MSVTECLLFLLAKAYQTVHQATREHLKPYGLTPIQCLVTMFIIQSNKQIAAWEIAKELKLDNATLSGILERLEAGGWIVRTLSQQDKRLSLISPTEKVFDLEKEIEMKRTQTEEVILQNFSLEEKLLLKRMLRDMK